MSRDTNKITFSTFYPLAIIYAAFHPISKEALEKIFDQAENTSKNASDLIRKSNILIRGSEELLSLSYDIPAHESKTPSMPATVRQKHVRN